MKIRYYQKNIYGQMFKYPIDHKVSLFHLTKTVTLQDRQIDALKELGVEFEEVLESSTNTKVPA